MKLKTRASIEFLICIVACIIILNIFARLFLKRVLIIDSKNQMVKYATEMKKYVPDDAKGIIDEIADMYDTDLIRGAYYNKDSGVYFSESKGRVIDRITGQTKKLLDDFNRQGENPYLVERHDDEDNVKKLYFVEKLDGEQYLIFNKTIKGVEQNVRLVSMSLIISGGLIAALGLVMWTILITPFAYIFGRMTNVSEKMAKLDFSERIGYHGDDEVGRLAASVDYMSEKLEESIVDIQREVDKQREMLRNLSHEIKTPLTTIKGYAEHTQFIAGDNEKVVKYCDIMIEECDALDNLAKEMMELSAISVGETIYEMEPFETADFFGQIERRVKRKVTSEEVVFEYDDAKVYGNIYLLQRALVNFIENARKYGDREKPIIVSGKLLKDSDLPIEDRKEVVTEFRYCISVRNYGEPIPEKESILIWDAFYKSDKSRKREGSYGVGLSIVKNIAEIHDADVGCKSEDDGNTFYIILKYDKDQIS